MQIPQIQFPTQQASAMPAVSGHLDVPDFGAPIAQGLNSLGAAVQREQDKVTKMRLDAKETDVISATNQARTDMSQKTGMNLLGINAEGLDGVAQGQKALSARLEKIGSDLPPALQAQYSLMAKRHFTATDNYFMEHRAKAQTAFQVNSKTALVSESSQGAALAARQGDMQGVADLVASATKNSTELAELVGIPVTVDGKPNPTFESFQRNNLTAAHASVLDELIDTKQITAASDYLKANEASMTGNERSRLTVKLHVKSKGVESISLADEAIAAHPDDVAKQDEWVTNLGREGRDKEDVDGVRYELTIRRDQVKRAEDAKADTAFDDVSADYLRTNGSGWRNWESWKMASKMYPKHAVAWYDKLQREEKSDDNLSWPEYVSRMNHAYDLMFNQDLESMTPEKRNAAIIGLGKETGKFVLSAYGSQLSEGSKMREFKVTDQEVQDAARTAGALTHDKLSPADKTMLAAVTQEVVRSASGTGKKWEPQERNAALVAAFTKVKTGETKFLGLSDVTAPKALALKAIPPAFWSYYPGVSPDDVLNLWVTKVRAGTVDKTTGKLIVKATVPVKSVGGGGGSWSKPKPWTSDFFAEGTTTQGAK